ncbi:MAG: hypothetical protein MK085_01740, partial [Phycisphaerales bacterium]|nr:hypothetical protein [Phycisphaerales bacterium]
MSRPRRRTPRPRRGAALLLVMVAMGVSVVLASAFLDSRSGSVPMADGLAAASRARHAANSGLDLALASIQANPQWHEHQHQGVLADHVDLDGTRLRIELKDVDTDSAPTEETTMLAVHALATVDGVEIGSRTVVRMPPVNPSLDLEFSEVALLARDEIRLEGDAVLVPWGSNAMELGVADPILIGTLDGDPEDVHVSGDAIAVNGVRLSVDARATAAGEQRGGVHLLPSPLPPLSASSVAEPDAPMAGDVVLAGEHSGDIHAGNIRISAHSSLRITGDSVIRSR